MQKSPKINTRKLIFQELLRNIQFISLVNILLFSWKNTKNNPADPSKPKKRWITSELLLVIIVVLIIIILPIILYTSGCMESTTYYNRRFV